MYDNLHSLQHCRTQQFITRRATVGIDIDFHDNNEFNEENIFKRRSGL